MAEKIVKVSAHERRLTDDVASTKNPGPTSQHKRMAMGEKVASAGNGCTRIPGVTGY